jgi:4,5-DOPA dioxygenase extradiol
MAMERKEFLKLMALAPLSLNAMNLKEFENFTDKLQTQSKKLPVLFTSHGNPMEIVIPKEQSPFWTSLFELGNELQKGYDVKAALVVSAHWCTKGTYVNISPEQTQIYDYYGFPKNYYDVKYQAKGAPEIAQEVHKIIPSVTETTEWGLDHGAWPMLMHLFPKGNIPVFQLSIDYYAHPNYHYELGKQLKALREKGVLIIGSGALIHNLPLAGQKMSSGDMTPYGWEGEYDLWIKKQIDSRNIDNIVNYETSHKFGKLAAPTPDHFVPVLYSLGLMDTKDEIQYFYEGAPKLPAFSERSFIIKS